MKRYTTTYIVLFTMLMLLGLLKICNNNLYACNTTLMVNIPKTIVLSSDDFQKEYKYDAMITARGLVASSQYLIVQAPNECVFSNNNYNVTGKIKFGLNNMQVWNNQQLYQSMHYADNRALSIEVPYNEIKYAGTYSSYITFNIELKSINPTPDYSKIFTYNGGTITGLTTYGKSLKKITIPSNINGQSITKVGENAFLNSGVTQEIIVSEGITSLMDKSFYNCSSLQSILLPNTLTFIGNEAFSYCQVLSSITIPNGVTSIGDRMFFNCSKLKSVSLPNTIVWIGSKALAFCCNLRDINIPNGTVSMGSHLFDYCSVLTSLTIPKSVSWIGDNAFYTCNNLTQIIFLNRKDTSDISLGANWKSSKAKIIYQ